MDNKPIKPKTLYIAILMAVIAFIFTNVGAMLYISGGINEKVNKMELELQRKPSNDVLLQYMKLTDSRFRANELSLNAHADGNKTEKSDLKSYVEMLEERINRIESIYLEDVYRSASKKKK